tara:strand:- start:322 stop:600 length:279 start_codon:yes stop_codon:yes gene_type:complete
MDKKDQRINVTLFSTLEYKMVKTLAELHGTSFSMVVAKGFSEWLKKNFIIELETYRDAEIHLKRINASAPTTLAEPDLSFNDDEDPHFWRGK